MTVSARLLVLTACAALFAGGCSVIGGGPSSALPSVTTSTPTASPSPTVLPSPTASPSTLP